VPWGGGVSLRREPAPERYDVALDTTALKRVTIYDPEDFTVTAECGITLDDLRATLAAQKQELPLEGAEAWGATLGGVLASNASGPRRRTLGAPRDRILGASFVTGDGVLAKTGGRVVKNVAGHAVHRLLVGSRGALAVFTQASLKLLPQPPARSAMVWNCDAAMLADAARWRDWPRREPAALTVVGRALAAKNPVLNGDAPYTVVAGFEDDAAWVADCGEFARRALGSPRVKVSDASVPPLWQQLCDLEEMPGPRLTFTTAANTPDAIAFLAGRPVAERLVFHAPCGRLHVWPAAEEAVALAKELAGRGFALLESRGEDAALPGPPGSVAALRTAIRRNLDPSGTFALDRG
jgi:FAD/FMN-containing dehydrogenase